MNKLSIWPQGTVYVEILSNETLLCTPLFGLQVIVPYTAWKVSKYGVISGPYFPVFSPNTEKYWPEITPYLDTFHAVLLTITACSSAF